MFAGISAIDVEEDNTLITAMSSREGERVRLIKPVSVKVCGFETYFKSSLLALFFC